MTNRKKGEQQKSREWEAFVAWVKSVLPYVFILALVFFLVILPLIRTAKETQDKAVDGVKTTWSKP